MNLGSVVVENLQSSVWLLGNSCNSRLNVILGFLKTCVGIRLEVVLGIGNIHGFVDSLDILGKDEPRLDHGLQFGICRNIVSLEPLYVVSELSDGSLSLELVCSVTWMMKVLVLVEDEANPMRMTSIGSLQRRCCVKFLLGTLD